jgi:cobalamin biosynthesis protein CobC
MAMDEARIWHGGDLDEARRLFPEAPEPWIDLSTGINPVPYPVPDFTPLLLAKLPSPGALADLEAAAAEVYEVGRDAGVVAAPGTQILISVLPHLRPRSRIRVLGPTYAEHSRAWAKASHVVSPVSSLGDVRDADVVVVVNPNNPDGRVIDREALLQVAEDLNRRGGWLVVDEAFADFETGITLLPHLVGGAIILRSFGKTYGLAGVRLGFAIAALPLAERIRTALGPWAVSGPAIEIGRKALRDREWLKAAAASRAADAHRLSLMLRNATGADCVGTTLYRTIVTPLTPALFDRLGRRGIWTRRFQDNLERLRIGLPPSEPAWMRLHDALGSCVSGDSR